MQVEEDSRKGDSMNNYIDLIVEIAFVHCGRQPMMSYNEDLGIYQWFGNFLKS